MAAWLSQKRRMGREWLIPKSRRSWLIQSSSLVVAAKAQYLASAEEREMLDCFLDFHETKQSLRKTQKPETDFCESRHEAQSTYEKAVSLREKLEGKKRLCPRCDFR